MAELYKKNITMANTFEYSFNELHYQMISKLLYFQMVPQTIGEGLLM